MATTEAVTELDRKLHLRALIATGEAKRIRNSANVTLEEVAADIGVHYMTVWRWENGHRAPRGADARRYLDALTKISNAVASERTATIPQ